MSKHNLNDWKKIAAQVLDDSEAELAFMEQAFAFIQNKAKPFMKGNYRLGFEIVYKNDEFTRAIGIFAFRIGKDLFYAPSFFVNGDIKGTDLLYSHKTKLFMPLNNDWVNYLISKHTAKNGEPIEQSETNRISKSLNLRDIARPPEHKKMASDTEDEFIFNKSAAIKIWEEITNDVVESLTKEAADDPESILKQFLIENPEVFEKFANTIEKDYEFANNVASLLTEDEYCPDEIFQQKKEASENTETEYELALHYGSFNPFAKIASTEQLAKGYSFEDLRKESKISLTFEAMETSLCSINDPGIYNIIASGGEMIKCFCAKVDSKHDYNDTIDYSCDNSNKFLIVDLENGGSKICYNTVTGEYVSSLSDTEENILHDSMSPGKAYYIFDTKSRTIVNTSPYFIKDKTTEDGVDIYTTKYNGNVRHNKDYTGCFEDGIAGDNHKFIEVSTEPDPYDSDYKTIKDLSWKVGAAKDVDLFIMGGGYKKAHIKASSEGFNITINGNRYLPGLSKLASLAVLMQECSLREDTAEELIKESSEKGETAFYFDKAGSQLHIDQLPDFYTGYDSDFGVLYEEPMTHVLQGKTEPDNFPQPRIGDKITHTSTTIIESATPNELAEYAKQIGNRNIFEHGIIGSLAKTYDAISLVNKYLPDMQEGLDRIGRLIFLFYWKPEDFIDAYGTDDQTDLENMLISNFKSFGDLVLELLRKIDDKDSSGSSSQT